MQKSITKESLTLAINLVEPLQCLLFLGSIISLWIITGILKEKQILCESDSRKINHIAVFVGGALAFGWLPELTARVNLYIVSTIILTLVILTCRYKDTNPFSYIYSANARASDSPNTTFFFWSSWCLSIAALATIDLLFTDMTVTRTALLIVGIADGIAEPIGKRFGKHCYAVFSFSPFSLNNKPSFRSNSFRSVEGSFAVWITTLLVILFSAHALSFWHQSLAAIAIASVITLVEALSPRGCDNFSILLTAAILTQSLLTTN